MKPFLSSVKTAFITLSFVAISTNALADQQCPLGEKENSAIQEICPFKNGMARIKIDHQWGFVNLAGQIAIAPQFDMVEDFSEGFAVAEADEKWGVIDKQGKWVVEPRFERLYPYSQGLAAAEENGKSGFIDHTGKWIIQPKYENAGSFYGSVSIVNEGYRHDIMIDKAGAVIKRFGPDVDVHNYANGFGLFEASVSFEPTLQNVDGRTLPYPKAASTDFDSTYQVGRLIAIEKFKRGEDTVELHGMVDLQGKWIIPPKFRSLELFHNGLAIASPDREQESDRDTFGLIDERGTFVVKPIYADIRLEEHGHYQASYANNRQKTDILDKHGKVLLTSDCADELSEKNSMDPTPIWNVYVSCGQTWVLHRDAGLIKSKVRNPEVSVTVDHMMLINEDTDGDTSDNSTKGKTFEIYNAAGKLVLSSDAPAIRGKYDNAMLVSSNGMMTQQTPHLLPVAILINHYRDVAVVTRDYTAVSNPEWEYESELLDYRHNHDDRTLEGPLVMKTDKGWGAVNANGDWVVPPQYRRLTVFRNGVAYAETDTQELIVDRDNKTYHFPENGRGFKRIAPYVLEGSGEDSQIIQFNLKTGTTTTITQPNDIYFKDFQDDLAPAQKNDLWGLIDKEWKWIVQPRFSAGIEPLLNEGKLIGWKSSNYRKTNDSYSKQTYGLLNPQGKELIPPRFSSLDLHTKSGMLFVAEDDSMHGVITTDGKTVVELFPGTPSFLGDGWFAIAKDDIHGLIDTRGEWALKPTPISVSDLGRDTHTSTGKRPYAMIEKGSGKVLMDIQGRISTREAPLSLEQDNPDWWWSEINNEDTENEFTVFYGFDFKERVRIPGQVDPYYSYSEGIVVFKPRKQSAKTHLGLANDKGTVLGVYPFEKIEPMRNGFSIVSQNIPTKSRIKKRRRAEDDGDENMRYGYLNRLGKLAIPLAFEMASDFAEGCATIVAAGNLGLIDEKGKTVLQGAWLCGRQPAILDSKKKILWPEGARQIQACP